MTSNIDIFELSLDLVHRCIEGKVPEKYWTLEVNMIVGAVFKSLPLFALIFSLEIAEDENLLICFFTLLFQSIVMKYETCYIYDGKSDTKKRQLLFKSISLLNDVYQFVFLISEIGDEISKLFTKGQISFSCVYMIIISYLGLLDFYELVRYSIRCCQGKENFNYSTPGQAHYFLKFRLIGGFLGTIAMLIFFIILRKQDEFKENAIVQTMFPMSIACEIIILITTMIQLCRKRKNQQFVVSDKVATEKQQIMKKWYCIIIGFTYGLFEVPIAGYVFMVETAIYISYFFFCFIFCCRCRRTSLCCADEIIDFEIVEQKEKQKQIYTIIK